MSTTVKTKPYQYVGVRLPTSEAQRLRQLAAAEDRSLGYLARKFIERGLGELTIDHRNEQPGGSAA